MLTKEILFVRWCLKSRSVSLIICCTHHACIGKQSLSMLWFQITNSFYLVAKSMPNAFRKSAKGTSWNSLACLFEQLYFSHQLVITLKTKTWVYNEGVPDITGKLRVLFTFFKWWTHPLFQVSLCLPSERPCL